MPGMKDALLQLSFRLIAGLDLLPVTSTKGLKLTHLAQGHGFQ